MSRSYKGAEVSRLLEAAFQELLGVDPRRARAGTPGNEEGGDRSRIGGREGTHSPISLYLTFEVDLV